MEEEAKIEMEALVLWRKKSHSCFLRLERKLPRSHPSPLLFWSLPPKKKIHLQLILIFPYCITSLICFSNTARVPYCLNLSWQSVIIQSSCAPHPLEVCTSKITTLGGLVTSAAAEKNFLVFFLVCHRTRSMYIIPKGSCSRESAGNANFDCSDLIVASV